MSSRFVAVILVKFYSTTRNTFQKILGIFTFIRCHVVSFHQCPDDENTLNCKSSQLEKRVEGADVLEVQCFWELCYEHFWEKIENGDNQNVEKS